MATIKVNTEEKIFQIKKWLGLNENPDGDTKLKMGEASQCLNWRVTRDGNLQRRPGQALVSTLSEDYPVVGIWSGRVAGYEYVLACCNGKAYVVFDGFTGEFTSREIGSVATDRKVHIFGFNEKAYFLDGSKYLEWDGTNPITEVVGYVPIISVSTAPSGGGTEYEQVNKLTGKRRVWFSPDGTATELQLPEKGLASINAVTNRATGEAMTGWTANLADGKVVFGTAPASGSNTIEVTYTVSDTFRSQVEAMRFSELFNGTQDSRVFLYGDGSNQVFYSGLDYDGNPRADYFPDLNVASIGAQNTPVTGLIRHYSRLLAFKTDSAWSITYGSITLEDGRVTAGFYVIPVNRSIGNEAPGQVQLVLNSPYTLFNGELYEWRNNSSYSSNLSSDERQARRISDRIFSTLSGYDAENCVCYDDNANQEYYIAYNGGALVCNYASDAWYKYDNMDVTGFASIRGRLVYGTSDGTVLELTTLARDDQGTAIDAYWESGAMDFNADYRRKYSSMLWVSVKPQTNSYVEITLITDRKSEFADKTVSTGVNSNFFETWDFNALSFFGNIQPQVKKIKLKAKKFGYYRLIFKSDKVNTTATVLGTDIRVRMTGYVK